MGRYSLVFILLIINICSGQVSPGAKHIALSNSDVALSGDVFSLFNNPAGITGIPGSDFGIFYSPAPFGMKELATGYAVVSHDLNYFRGSAGFSIYGFELYKENTLYLGLSKEFYDNFSTGITFSLTSISIKNYGSTSVLRLNLGMIYSVMELADVGFTILNLSRSQVKNDNRPLPVCYNFGLSFYPVNDLVLNIALEKEIYFNPSYRFGVEYKILDFIALRSGVATEPDTFSGGIGIFYSIFNFSYAFKQHNVLGMTHQIDLIIKFINK
jgi:hypothetical protein